MRRGDYGAKKWMLILLVPLMVQLTCHGIPLFGPRFNRGYRMKSISVSRRSAMQLHLRLSMQPTNKRTIKLCSRNQNVFIQVNSNGVVNGTHERNSKYSLLVQEALAISIVRLKGLATNRYIAMNRRGKVYSTALPNDESLFFTNQEENYYHTFWSYMYENSSRSWLLSVKRNGKMRRGSRTRVGEKSTQFLIVLHDNSSL